MNWPTADQINDADHLQLGKWLRFLPSPETGFQRVLLDLIVTRFEQRGGWTPEISKAIGWN